MYIQNKYGYCIYTEQIEEKTNEIPTIENLIKGLNLKGIIATWDALNTQTKNVKAVIEAGGNYIVPIKGNQGMFYKDLIDYFDEEECEKIIAGKTKTEYMTYYEKSHGVVIKYELFQTSNVKWYSKINDWEGIKSFGLVRKTITQKKLVKNERKNAKKEKIEKEITTVENRYYISTTLNKKALLNLGITHKFVLVCLERVKKKIWKKFKSNKKTFIK